MQLNQKQLPEPEESANTAPEESPEVKSEEKPKEIAE